MKSLLAATLCVALLALAGGGCASATRSVLYPEAFAVGLRTGNRTNVQGLNFTLSWKLKPRVVVPADGTDRD